MNAFLLIPSPCMQAGALPGGGCGQPVMLKHYRMNAFLLIPDSACRPVRCLAVDAGNEWFVTGSADRTIKIWDLATGQLRLTLTGHIEQACTSANV